MKKIKKTVPIEAVDSFERIIEEMQKKPGFLRKVKESLRNSFHEYQKTISGKTSCKLQKLFIFLGFGVNFLYWLVRIVFYNYDLIWFLLGTTCLVIQLLINFTSIFIISKSGVSISVKKRRFLSFILVIGTPLLFPVALAKAVWSGLKNHWSRKKELTRDEKRALIEEYLMKKISDIHNKLTGDSGTLKEKTKIIREKISELNKMIGRYGTDRIRFGQKLKIAQGARKNWQEALDKLNKMQAETDQSFNELKGQVAGIMNVYDEQLDNEKLVELVYGSEQELEIVKIQQETLNMNIHDLLRHMDEGIRHFYEWNKILEEAKTETLTEVIQNMAFKN